MHLAPGEPNVTIGVKVKPVSTPTFINGAFVNSIAATANQGFMPVDAGTYTFDIRLADGTTSFLPVRIIAANR